MYANSATSLKRLESGIDNLVGSDAVVTTIGIEAGAAPKHCSVQKPVSDISILVYVPLIF